MTGPLISARGFRCITRLVILMVSGAVVHCLVNRLLIRSGLVGMQINLRNSGTLYFMSDHCHVIENVRINPDSTKFNKVTCDVVA